VKLLNVQEAAAYTGLSHHTIYALAAKRRIPVVKLGRRNLFDPAALDRWIGQHTVQPEVTDQDVGRVREILARKSAPSLTDLEADPKIPDRLSS